MEAELRSGGLRSRKRFTREETAAMKHVMGSTRPGDPRRYIVKEMVNEVLQTKNPDWFE